MKPINGEIILLSKDAKIYFGILSALFSVPIASNVIGIMLADRLREIIERAIEYNVKHRHGRFGVFLSIIQLFSHKNLAIFWMIFIFSLVLNGIFLFFLLSPLMGTSNIFDAVGHLANLGAQIGPLLWLTTPFSLMEIVSIEAT